MTFCIFPTTYICRGTQNPNIVICCADESKFVRVSFQLQKTCNFGEQFLIVGGVLSHQMKQFVIDGNKVVLSVSNPDTRVDDAEFEENEVYAIDIVASTGDGKVIWFY